MGQAWEPGIAGAELGRKDIALVRANARIMELERSLALSNRQVDNMADVLGRCREKLTLCIQNHGAKYIGGTEHSHLMKLINAALPPLK